MSSFQAQGCTYIYHITEIVCNRPIDLKFGHLCTHHGREYLINSRIRDLISDPTKKMIYCI